MGKRNKEACDANAAHNWEVKQYRFLVKDVPSERDIAVFGAKKVYRLAICFLHRGRKAGWDVLLRYLGYILVDWKPHCDLFEQYTRRMMWGFPEHPAHPLDVNSISRTSRKSDMNGVSCDNYNFILYETLVKEHCEMIFCVDHGVFVTKKAGNLSKKGEVKRISKCLNLIYVTMQFCLQYNLLGGEDISRAGILLRYLRGHDHALWSIYCVSYY